MMKKIIMFVCLILNVSFAQLTFDRTRIVFDHSKGSSHSVVVTNTNATDPFLAQSWIEDSLGNKITDPLVALPILQRINAGQKKQIKVSITGDISVIPTDRESLFFFNVLGVAPKTMSNELKASIQSELKIFYRPKALPKYKEMGWVEEMTLEKTRHGVILHNPSAYHIIIYGFASKGDSKITTKSVTLKPFSSENVQVKLRGDILDVLYINDFGGGEIIRYNCSSSNCSIVQ